MTPIAITAPMAKAISQVAPELLQNISVKLSPLTFSSILDETSRETLTPALNMTHLVVFDETPDILLYSAFNFAVLPGENGAIIGGTLWTWQTFISSNLSPKCVEAFQMMKKMRIPIMKSHYVRGGKIVQ